MKDCLFTLVDSDVKGRPQIVNEAFEVMECTWDDSLEEAYNDKPGCIEGYDPPYRRTFATLGPKSWAKT